jgi:hypothetical protein
MQGDLRVVLNFAREKLTPSDRTDDRDAHLAWLSWRIMLDFSSSSEARELESRLVQSYLRVVFVVPEHRRFMRTGTPSEPVLAEAAAQLLAQHQVNIPQVLRKALSSRLLARGERGEIVARAIFIQSHDAAAKSLPALHGCLQYHRPIPLLLWLKHMFHSNVYEKILQFRPVVNTKPNEPGPTLKDAFEHAWVHFSHFSLAGDYKVVRLRHLPAFGLRGTAVQAYDNQTAIDGCGSIHFKDPNRMQTDSEDPLESVGIAQKDSSHWDWQAKSRRAVGDEILPWHIADPNKENLHPTLSFFLELGDADPPVCVLEQVEAAESFPRLTRGAKDSEMPQTRHYQINVRGLQSFCFWDEQDVENIQAALAMTKYTEGFPRQHEDNVRLLDQTQSMWATDSDSMLFWTAGGEVAHNLAKELKF